jgi:membrane protein required for beta-lactamase induction
VIFFISIIVSVAIELGLKSLESWRKFDWFSQLTDWVTHQMDSTSFRDGPLVVLAILAPVLFVVWLVSAMLGGVWFLFEFAFGVAVLSMSLGPSDPIRQTQDYINALQNNDAEEARLHAAKIMGKEVTEGPTVTAEYVKEALFIKVCTSILAVFFWFIVLGPVGAAMFRLTCLLQERYTGTQSGLASAISDFYRILMWIPSRFTVLFYALVGSFVGAMHAFHKPADFWQGDNEELLAEAGLASLHVHIVNPELSKDTEINIDSLVSCLSLAKRAVLACITFLALVVILSWIF